MIAPLKEKMYIGESMTKSWMLFFTGLSDSMADASAGQTTQEITAGASLTKDASTIICTNDAPANIKLPMASTMKDKSIAFFASGKGSVTIVAIPPDTIDGGTSFTIQQYEMVSARSTGDMWLLF